MYFRIMIFGRPGSGKSTFSLKLAQKTGISLYHLDKYFYKENWIEHEYEQFLMMQKKIVDQSQWIIDGNALQSLDIRYSRADLCLYFNYPRWFCIWRILKRIFKKDSEIDDRAQGCKERISWNLIKYTWTFEYRKNNRLINQLEQLKKRNPHVAFIEIKNDQELKEIYTLILE